MLLFFSNGSMRRLLLVLGAAWLLGACASDSEKNVDVSAIRLSVKVNRLEQELFSLKNRDEVKRFLEKNKLISAQFLSFPPETPDSAKIDQLYALISNPELRLLYRETQQQFGDFSQYATQLEDAFRHVKYYYPDFKAPAVHTIVTGFGNDMFVSDSLVVIGLEYYLGDSASYRPNVPQYLLKRFRPEYIVPNVLLLVSKQYNQTARSDNTLLSDMLFYGKSYEFASYMLPDTPDSLIVGYSGEQLIDTRKNLDVIWSHFIQKKLLYETSFFTKTKYIDERPYTAEIGSKAPGAIGRWLGWEIIKAYRKEHPEVTLPELMRNGNAQQIFSQSNYKGNG